MQVAIISHNIFKGDGQGRVNYELTRAFLRQGIAVDLIADQVAPELLEAGATWTRVTPRAQRVHLFKVWEFARRVDRILDRSAGRYDAVLACGVVASRPHAVNAAHFVHGTWLRSPFHASKARPGLNGTYQRVYSTFNARWEREVFAQAEVVIAVSEMVRQELIDIGVPPASIEVIVNGVDTEEYAPGSEDRTALGLPEDVPLGLFVGDLRSPIKNLDTVLEELADQAGIHLAIAGEEANSVYPALAMRLGLSGRVHFLGFRRDIAALMRAADFFVLTSRRDSCPLVLLEALASGLPAITARTVGTANLVEAGAGFVLESPDDREVLKHATRTLAFDEAKRREMGCRAREIAKAHSWEKMAGRYLEVLRRVSIDVMKPVA